MRDVAYLAWRYLASHRAKTAVLVGSVALVLALPAGLQVLLERSRESLTVRAEETPLLVGARGSPLELVLSSLYFESDDPPAIRYAELDRVNASGLATGIPLYTRFAAQGFPIVGTSPEYLTLRSLTVERGRSLAILGECLLGAAVARTLDLEPGDTLVSSPETLFDLAGAYPLAMQVVGVLAPTDGPDDRGVFVDVKTAWVMAGLAHGHEDLTRPEAAGRVLSREDGQIVANAAVREFTEITADNLDAFHFHGDPSGFPLSAIIALPHDARAAALLEGRYVGEDEAVQIVRSRGVMDELLATVLTVQRYVSAAVVGIGLATVATMSLVFVLSLQVRRREIETMVKLGCSRQRLTAILSAEIAAVLVSGVAIAALVAATLWRYGDQAVRLLIRLS